MIFIRIVFTFFQGLLFSLLKKTGMTRARGIKKRLQAAHQHSTELRKRLGYRRPGYDRGFKNILIN